MRKTNPKLRPHPIAAAAIAAIGLTSVQAAPVTWIGPNASFWDLAANWNVGLPGATDAALLGAFDTTFRSGTVTIQSFTGTGTLTVNGGTLRTTQNSSIANLAFNGGALSGVGTITTGTLNWSGGTMGESAQGGGTTTVTGATTLDGTAVNYLYYGRTLNLNGNTTWSAGNGQIYVYSGGQGNSALNIAAGTTFADAGAASATGTKYIGYYGDGSVNNAGTYNRNGLGTTSTYQGIFNNTGTVNVNSGRMSVGGGASTGTYTVASGATLEFASGTHNVNGGTLTNNGTLEVGGGTANLAAAVSYAGTGTILITGGLLNSAVGSSIAPGSMTINGGTGRFAGNVNTGLLTMTGGTLSGPGTVTASGLDWSGGTMGENAQGGGTTTISGASTIDGTAANYLYYGRTLNLNGNTAWTAGNGAIYIYSAGQGNSTLNIGAGSTFTDAGATAATGTKYIGYYGDGSVNNAGTYIRNGVGTTSIFQGQFNNTGAVNVNGGKLAVGGGTSTGTYTVASGATLEFAAGTHNVNGGTLTNNGTLEVGGGTANLAAAVTYAGTGTILITGGLLNSAVGSSIAPGSMTINSGTGRFAGNVNTGLLTMTGGILSGPGTLTATGLDWSGGTMGENAQGGGTTTISGASTIDGTAANYLYYGRTLNLNSNTAWTAGNGGIYTYSAGQGNSTLNIGAGSTFTDAGASGTTGTRYIGYYGDGAVNNAGTYNRNGLGTTSIYQGQFNNTGAVNVNGGRLALGGGVSTGAYTVASGATLEFASGTSNLNGGTLTNNGTLEMGGGTANLAAAVTYAGTGTILITGGLLNSAVGSSIAPGSMTISGGTGRFAGNVNTGPLVMTGGILSGTGTVTASSLNWSGGNFGENAQSGGTTTITGTSTIDGADNNYVYYGHTLNLNGNTTWTAGTGSTYLYSAGQGTSTLNMGAGTTFTDAGNTTAAGTRYLGYYGDGQINNAGTYNRNGVGITAVGPFNNSGTVNVNGGTLRFDGNGSSSGAFNLASGAVLDFSAAQFSLTGGSLSNAGTTRVSGGRVEVAAPLVTSGTGLLQVTGGTLRMLAGSSMSPSNVSMTGGAISGPGTINAGALSWSGGSFGENGVTGGVFNVSGAATIDGTDNNYVYYGHTLNLNGNTTWTAGTTGIYLYGAGQGTSTLNIGTGANFTDAGDSVATGTRYLGYYGDGQINNAGTYSRNGVGITAFGPLNNTGTVNVNGGTLRFDGNGSSSGAFSVAAGAVLDFSATQFSLTGGSLSNAGTTRVSGGRVEVAAPLVTSGTGLLEVTGGTLRMLAGSSMSPSNVSLTGGTISGPGTINAGALSWSGGSFGENGVTGGVFNVSGAATIDGTDNNYVYYGHTLNLNGNTTWTAGTGSIYLYSVAQGTSTLNIGAGATFTDAGDTTAAGIRYLGYYGDGQINNAGTYNRNGVGITAVSQFNNTGTVNANGGTLRFDGNGSSSGAFSVATGAVLDFSATQYSLTGGSLSNAGTTRVSGGRVEVAAPLVTSGSGLLEVTGGTLRMLAGSSMAPSNVAMTGGAISGPGTINAGTLNWSGGTFGENQVTGGVFNVSGATTIDGTDNNYVYYGHTLSLNGNTTWTSGTGSIYLYSAAQGTSTLNIGAGATFTDAGNATATATRYIGYYGDGQINNAGTYNRNGLGTTVVGSMNNTGVFNANAGITTFQDLQGTGTLQVAAGAEANATTANTTVGTLLHNGNTAASLELGSRTVTVSSDYVNASWGVGNAFDRRANIGITNGGAAARLLASGNANQALSGAGVSNGNTATPTLVVGNVHVGATNFAYNIENTGTSGPSLRGAIQNGANGGNITDARLSGDGVSSSNWGPVAPGGSTTRDVTVTVSTAGVYTPITSQTVSIVNNFENTRGQLLTISSSAGAAAYNLASAAAVTPSPVTVANQRIGGTAATQLTVANVAPTGSFTERLNASFGAVAGDASGNGGTVSQLVSGASNASALAARVDTTTAGAKTGTVQVNFASDGTGTSGLGVTALASQTLTVNGNVYQLAAGQLNTAPLNFGTVQVGQVVSRQLSVTNSATGPAGFVEDLSARFGATSGTGAALISGSGSITGLAAGATNTSALAVALNTAAAGVVNGAIAVNYFSAGTVGGVSNGLGELAVGSSSYGVSGTIETVAVLIDQAAPVLNTASVNLGNVRVGATSPTQFVSVTNQATTAPQAALNASIAGTAPITATGSFNLLAPGATNASALQVGMSTANAGAVNGTATVSFVSDASNVGGCAPTCQLDLAPQNVSVSGNVFRLATGAVAPAPISFGNVRIGGTAQQVLAVTNASAADGFSERLNAAFGGSTGSTVTTSGTVTQLQAGAAADTTMNLALGTATAGAKSGTVTVSFASDGTGTTGVAASANGTQVLNFSGNVYQLAAGQLNTAPLNFGTVQVGQSVSQQLSITNSATGPSGFVEDLAARFGASSGTSAALISGSGSITGLVAGATDTSTLRVAVDTSAAGSVSGAIAVNYFSAGSVAGVSNGLGELAVGSSSYGVTGSIQAVANVINQAAPVINTPSINLGNVRIGSASPTQFVSLTNQATTAPQAALSASIIGTAPIVASGSVDLLAPGGTSSNALQVGMSTAAAGAVSGTATVALVSDASNVGGCAPNCQLTLAPSNISVTGAVYRFASPTITSGSINLAARVGDLAPSSAIAITNASPDAYTERLNASAGAAPSGFTTGGAINGLVAGGSSTAIGVSLNTAAAGSYSGQVGLNFVSSGAGTTGAADAALAGQNVAVSGRVYAPAVGQVNTTVVDFGIVHRGDTVAARNVSVTNAAAPAALNDTLRGTLGGAAGPFAASGTLGGVSAGATDTASFNVALDTTNAGVYSGSATAALASHNADMSDLSLGNTAVALTAQVNNYAELGLGKTGSGTLTQVGSTYTLDFGNLQLGGTNLAADLGIFNLATGPADLLNGTFSIGSGTGFTLGAFNSFADVAAGSSVNGYSIGFGSAGLGSYSQTITISAIGTNASGFAGGLGDTTLVLRGSVVAVPEPGTWAMFAAGVLGLWVARRRALRHAVR